MVYLGLDIGSTSVKAVVVDKEGNILGRGKKAYPTEAEGCNSTQSADDWWGSAVAAVREAVSVLENTDEVAAMSVSAQGGSILALDGDFNPLTRAMTWMDRRSTAEAAEICGEFGERVYGSCGWRTSPADCAAKLLWLKRNNPTAFGSAAIFATTGDYINYKLTKMAVSDPSGAAITRLYDISKQRWNAEMLSYIGVCEDRLPRVLPSGVELGSLCSEAALELGLPGDVRVYNGAHDQYCASLGSGVIAPGELLLATGTAWVIFGVIDSLNFNKRYIAPGIHPIRGLFGAMTSIGGIGGELENFARREGLSLFELDAGCASRRRAARELLIYPCPNGALSPTKQAEQYDIYERALAFMEGAAFEVKLALEAFRDERMAVDRTLTMSGGAARSKLWSSLVGHICENEVMITKEPDTPALGAAMIAAVGSSAFLGYEDCAAKWVKKIPLAVGDAEIIDFYIEKFMRFRAGRTL